MSLFVIGDLHLSLSDVDKRMDVFGGWENYIERIEKNWLLTVKETDHVILLGDISWGMDLKGALEDFRFIDALPGKKLIVKGNHDYWWTSRKKIEEFFAKNRLPTLSLIHNSAFLYGNIGICATRGWLPDGTEHDKKLINREVMRLEASLKCAKDNSAEELIAFLHYPPVYSGAVCAPMLELMHDYGVKRCYFGHIHSAARKNAVEGNYLGINFRLVSADHLGFTPLEVQKT